VSKSDIINKKMCIFNMGLENFRYWLLFFCIWKSKRILITKRNRKDL